VIDNLGSDLQFTSFDLSILNLAEDRAVELDAATVCTVRLGIENGGSPLALGLKGGNQIVACDPSNRIYGVGCALRHRARVWHGSGQRQDQKDTSAFIQPHGFSLN
jgi:hypothetical protein